MTRKEPIMLRWRRLRANPRSANIALLLCGIMIASIPLAPLAIGYYLEAAIHEGGHAAACVGMGNSIVKWSIRPGGASVDCSRANDPIVVAGGLALGTLVWLLATPILTRHVFNWCFRDKPVFWLLAFIWVQWSTFCLGDLLISAAQVLGYARTGVLPRSSDAANFVKLTGAAPQLVIATLLGPLAILLLFVFLPCFFTIVETASQLDDNLGFTK
jgi:hypothetical protein